MDHAIFAVIKALCTPSRVLTLVTVVEELPCSTIKHIDTFGCVLNCMRMNHIQENADTHLMCLIYKIF